MAKNTTALWLFDLDNTLHDASHAIFPAIHQNMNAFMARTLGSDGVDADAATVNAAREMYWRRYGATLLGLVKHHQVRPVDFLREAHRFDDLLGMIRAERGLIDLLKRLPGRKILLTNAPQRYSGDVLRHLRLQRHFGKHISIESMHVHRQLRPKPSRHLLRQLLAREKVAARRCVLVEDTIATLKAAKSVGMRTAWVTQYLADQSNVIKRPKYVDVKVKSVRQLARNLHRLR
ncbi:HAD hydrolase, IA, variant 3 family protein [Collimonas fungivorans]|jgi:putative hydrolase of the HAD superfamily|uniref:HAD hydrolase, IA, variant 3 family protein n=1 Tax=Collimonas fungivorans TaxID=158899 RepID=A0A127PIF5_9BURK|nr:HAD-IA family hydrolase [Collimonas fungivorans]AMO97540.1 HAD hydrolase, IA, variant 3 family protein [Collimonas fungivorans]